MSSMQNNEAQVISRAPVRVNSDAYIRSRKRKHVRERFLMTITHLVLIIGGISMIVPFLWMLSTSLKEPGAVFTFPPQWIPKPVMWENYVRAWKASRGSSQHIFIRAAIPGMVQFCKCGGSIIPIRGFLRLIFIATY
jgi:ABC-type glycerol-3-phosphate transport system permease component